MRRMLIGAGVLSAALLAFTATGVATAAPAGQGVAVTGAVAGPARYTAAQLAALPQSSYPVTGFGGPRTVTGVNLEDLVEKSAPQLPPGKNTQLRVTLTVTSRAGRAETFALGELDPAFGDHPAVLTTAAGRIGLIVPGDGVRLRSLADVTGIRVGVSAAGVVTPPAGSVEVITGHRTVTLPAALLDRLPKRTESVTFLEGTTPQTHTETGPELPLVLLLAGVLPGPDTAVTAVGDDGYGAVVTLAEDYVGGRPLLLSTAEDGAPLAEPRLVADGDVKGGRDVSGVVELTVGS